MPIPVNLVPGTLPYECWPELPQTINVDIVTRIVATLDVEFAGVYVSATTPPVDQRDKVWFNLTDYEWYRWTPTVGGWARKHRVPPGPSDYRTLWAGLEPDLITYDSGQAGAVSVSTGPIWEVDHDWDNRIPIGADTTGGTPIVNAPGVETGDREFTLDTTKLPAHTHDMGLERSDLPDSTVEAGRLRDASGNVEWQNTSATPKIGRTRSTGVESADMDPISIIPPVRGLFVIKRTAREWILA